MRTRRNGSSATSPNSPIDLTSLLDVIFIMLFIVILAYSQAAQDLKLKQAELEQNGVAVSGTVIDQRLHSDIISEYTELIAAGTTDPNVYLKRGDEYLKIAMEEDYYDAYDYANKDYIVAFNLGGDLSDRAESIVTIYEAKAEKAKEDGDNDAYHDYLERAEWLIPSEERKAIINQLNLESLKPFANKKRINQYYDVEGNYEDYYSVTKYDERGFHKEMSTYDGNDNLIDTYTNFEFDQYGNCLRSAVFSTSSNMFLHFYEERVSTYNNSGTLLDIKYYQIGTGEYLGQDVNDYDTLGRLSGYHTYDAITGECNGYVVYLYDETDAFWATDTYDADGNLLYHDIYEE